MTARNSLLTAVAWLLVQFFAREVGVKYSNHNGHGVAVYVRRIPSQVWIHYNPAGCATAGIDYKKDTGRWSREYVGVQWNVVGGPIPFSWKGEY